MRNQFIVFLRQNGYIIDYTTSNIDEILRLSYNLDYKNIYNLLFNFFNKLKNILFLNDITYEELILPKYSEEKVRDYIKNSYIIVNHKIYENIVISYTVDGIFKKNLQFCKGVVFLIFSSYQDILYKAYKNGILDSAIYSRSRSARRIKFDEVKYFYKFSYVVTSIVFSLIFISNIFFIWYIANLTFRIFIICTNFLKKPHKKKEDDNNTYVLKKYTIFVPMCYETEAILKQSINGIMNLEYPKCLLDIKILIEEYDTKMIEMIKKITLPECFSFLIIPYAFPRNKPKALNFACSFSRFDYVGIYDAEDVPDKMQLINVSKLLSTNDNLIVAVQGPLSYYNACHNVISVICATEYFFWFNIMLSSVSNLNGFIPLGGTTNFILYDVIEKCGRWNVFNVTEDIEMACKIVTLGYKIKYLHSFSTKEESVTSLSAWIKQRTRWIKGYIITFVDYFFSFEYKDMKIFDKICFNNLCLFVIINSFLIGVIMILLVMNAFNIIALTSEFAVFLKFLMPFSIIFILYQILFSFFTLRIGILRSFFSGLCLCFYPMVQCIAFCRAMRELLSQRISFWDKTTHGICLLRNDNINLEKEIKKLENS